jgi:HEPN domain-containing protein
MWRKPIICPAWWNCAPALNQVFRNLKEVAAELTDYAVASRYPDDWRDIPLAEAIEAVGLAEMILSFIQGKIGI